MPALPRLFRGLGLGSLAVIVALGLALPLTARASGTGKGEGSGVQWLRMTHADFQEFLHENPQGVTLVFSAADGTPLLKEARALRNKLDDAARKNAPGKRRETYYRS